MIGKNKTEKNKMLKKDMQTSKFQKIAQKEKMRERGITVIALAITIIIMLILIGVTISQITGDNGLIRNAMSSGFITK